MHIEALWLTMGSAVQGIGSAKMFMHYKTSLQEMHAHYIHTI